MLKYSVKLNNVNSEQEELVWGEKYLDPNLSFVSGVTDASNHLEKYDRINTSNPLINSSALATLEAENVIREGYVVVKGKKYDVFDGKYIDYAVNQSGDPRNYKCVFINGKYYYGKKISKRYRYVIDDWLQVKDGKVVSDTISASTPNNTLKLDTIYWIEDGKVTIDGNTYLYDRNRNGLYLEGIDNEEIIDASGITKCDSISGYPYSSMTEYGEVTKFRLTKDDELNLPFENITHCKYYSYVNYKNHYCPIYKVTSGDSYHFECQIPNYVLYPEQTIESGITSFIVYYISESSDGVLTSDTTPVSSSTVGEHYVYDISDLRNIIAYIIVDGFVFYVESDMQNANDGKKLAIYLQDTHASVSIGDVLRFRDMSTDEYDLTVHTQSGDTREFVVYANRKYYIEENLCDKLVIENVEYDIEYINGKKNNVDCLVTINGEQVPFLIQSDTTTTQAQKYGKIVSGVTSGGTIVSSGVTFSYDIKPYSGVTINGKKYIVKEGDNFKYAEIKEDYREYLFEVDDIKGSSLLICKPYLSESEFNMDFANEISKEMCNDVVQNQGSMFLYSKNKIFGEKEITKELAFTNVDNPTSSDDYYDLLDNLKIYVKRNYINLSLQLNASVGGNPIQDNIVERDFFESETNRAINPIIDMEKDVYYPKFIDNNEHKYEGSSTSFKPIRQINLNLHFRTRDVNPIDGNWKVYEDYNDASKKCLCNWFVTDYPFYQEWLYKNPQSGSTLQEASDLMGMLFFTNYDVYYQKNKLAKSFVRLSYYDSTDPQKQQLLATSTVFMDEHALFKKYIDNSRKIKDGYTIVSEPSCKLSYEVNKTEGNKAEVHIIVKCGEDEKYDENIEISDDFKEKEVTDVYYCNKSFYIVFDDKSQQIVQNVGPFEEEVKTNKISVFTEFGDTIDETKRLSSRLTIKNRYESDTSSEGFYVYMFKEYSENLKPKPIYMKVEFNHASVGKTIPFTIPMHWSGNTNTPISGEVHPVSALTVGSDEIKKGYPLSYVYAQSYIPLYAVYDFKNKEYAYVFDDRYFIKESNEKIYKDGVVNLNLFEIKIQNEEGKDNIEDKQTAISNRQQVKAVIDINSKQFKTQEPTCT